jgi:hypothetical protein
MQKSLILFVLMIITSISYSQNLVQNGDFEDLNNEPCGITNTATEFNDAMLYWVSPTLGSPEIYLTSIDPTCYNYQPNSTYSGPIGIKGSQEPHSGDAFVGFFAYTISGLNQREYIQIQLSNTMLSGNPYIVEFYVSLADSIEYSVNNVGAYLSEEAVFASDNGVLDYDAQLVFPTFISDTENWVHIIDTITPTTDINFITIGNFNDDAGTATQLNPEGGDCIGCYGAYYYIDDVSITEYLGTSVQEQKWDADIHAYPNPFTSYIDITCEKALQDLDITMIDASGKTITPIKDAEGSKIRLQLNDLKKGVYFINIKHKYGMETLRVIKVDE